MLKNKCKFIENDYTIHYLEFCYRLQRFEKTNEMLTNCNALSASRLKTVAPEFKKHTQLLLETKKDLDYIFKKIRAIKQKLSAQYPEEFAEAVRSSIAEECEEDETSETKTKECDNDRQSTSDVIESTVPESSSSNITE